MSDDEEYYVPSTLHSSKRFESMGLARRQRDHMSRQFVYVQHGTQSEVPPHELDGPEAFHVGTPMAAKSRMSPELMRVQPAVFHTYRISRDAMAPVRFGDFIGEQEYDKHMSGLQPDLFESVSFDKKAATDYIKSSNLVLPYRNHQEDKGSTSFLVPKSRIGNGVEYLGSQNSRRRLSPEEVAEYKKMGFIQ